MGLEHFSYEDMKNTQSLYPVYCLVWAYLSLFLAHCMLLCSVKRCMSTVLRQAPCFQYFRFRGEEVSLAKHWGFRECGQANRQIALCQLLRKPDSHERPTHIEADLAISLLYVYKASIECLPAFFCVSLFRCLFYLGDSYTMQWSEVFGVYLWDSK